MVDHQVEKRVPRIMRAQILLIGLLLALGLESMLSKFDFENIYFPSLLVLFTLVIVVIWMVQLTLCWEFTFETKSVKTLPFGGMLNLWIFTVDSILLYLACRYYYNYSLFLLFFSLTVLVEFVESVYQVMVNQDSNLKTYNLNWVKADLIKLPSLGLLWFLYFTIEPRDGAPSPTLISSILLFSGTVLIYFFDMWNNRDYYGTTEFWKKLPGTKRKFQETKNR